MGVHQPGSGGGGGGSQPGAAIVRHFPFTFATAGLATGATIYTPTVGDILLAAWMEVDTAWNGTTPKGDFGSFSAHFGWLGNNNAPKDMTHADTTAAWDTDLLNESISAGGASGDMLMSWLTNFAFAASPPTDLYRGMPVKFATAAPIKVCVSQNGEDNGGDPVASQGSGVVYLVTATPA